MNPSRYKISYLFPAQTDLISVVDYIAQDSPRAAEKMLDRLEKAIDRLSTFPFLGKIPDDDELRRRNYRMLIVSKYLVFYQVKKDIVEIHRIIDGARDYRHLF